MPALLLRIRLNEPGLFPRLEGDPNSVVSQLYIPGSAVRGALIGLYLAARGKRDIDELPEAQHDEARQLFFGEQVRFLNAYPAIRPEDEDDFRRTLPTSRKWLKEKLAPTDRPFDVIDAEHPQHKATAPLPAGAYFGFADAAGKAIKLARPETLFTVHVDRNARFGRAMPPEKVKDHPGTIFRYEALAPGQVFVGAILFCSNHPSQNTKRATTIKELLGAQPAQTSIEIQIGGSRQAEYGGVSITWREESDWDECGAADLVDPEIHYPDTSSTGENSKGETGSRIVLTLLSNALVRNNEGQFATTLNLEEINAILERGPAKKEIPASFVATEVVGGFNRKWNLPLPQTVSIAAGSAFVLQPEGKFELDELKKLQARGIGERRNEGFGRISLALQEPLTAKPVKRVRGALGKESLSEDARTVAQLIATRLCLRMIRKRIEKEALTYRLVTREPSNAQLSRLRLAAREASRLAAAGGQSASQYWDSLLNSLRSHAKEQLKAAGIEGGHGIERLLEWLQRMGDTEVFKADVLGGTATLEDAASLGDVKPVIPDVLSGSTKEELRISYEALKFEFIERTLGLLSKKRRKELGKKKADEHKEGSNVRVRA
jgi:CRISPR-associated protein Csx10